MSASTHLHIGRADGEQPDFDEVTRSLAIEWDEKRPNGYHRGYPEGATRQNERVLWGSPQLNDDEEDAEMVKAWPLTIENDDRDSANRLRWSRAAFEKLREAGGYAVALEDDTLGELDRFPAGVGPAL